MTVENIGTAAWVVQLSNDEAEDMGCRKDSYGADLADKAAELTGCGTNCAAQIYYGHGEVLLFLTERGSRQALFRFDDFEALLSAVQTLCTAVKADLYAAEDGYILAISSTVPPSMWDHGRTVPNSALSSATPLIQGCTVETLRKAFNL